MQGSFRRLASAMTLEEEDRYSFGKEADVARYFFSKSHGFSTLHMFEKNSSFHKRRVFKISQRAKRDITFG